MSLERKFYDIPNVELDPSEQVDWLVYYGHGRELVWDTLLQSQRVLIVSEAGMGKTHECKNRQRHLWGQGEPAFFIELASLRDGDFRPQLGEDQIERLEAWERAQTEVATFFLDSVDEYALTQGSFDLTLRQLGQRLRGRLDRARIVITTRPIPLDMASVQRHLPVPEVEEDIDPENHFADVALGVHTTRPKKDEPSPVWRQVALAPLDEPLMRQIATEKSVKDVDRLMSAIGRHHAHDFAKRPLDFIALCADWNVHGKLRTHREQIESDVDFKLLPRTRDDRLDRIEISTAKAREGAERLALAALLTRRYAFWHSSDKDPGRGDNALNPSLVLDDFGTPEVWALMERGLFGLATYGRVRFHNRSVIEYLAARRLFSLRRDGMPVTTLKRLLFASSPMGMPFVKPSMRPVAAWLAADLPEVLEEVCRREPDVLLRHGDPEQLSLEVRARALARFVQVHGNGKWRGQNVPSLQLQRFAHPDLAPCVESLWHARVENPEVRDILLELIGAGGMHACVDIAYASAIDTKAPDMERLHGLLSLAELGDLRLPGLFDSMAQDPGQWPEKLVDSTILNLFPQHIEVSRLVGLLGRLTYRKRSYGGARSVLPRICETAHFTPFQLITLIQGIAALVDQGASWSSSHHRLKTTRRDLIATLLVLCQRQLKQEPNAPGVVEAAVLAVAVSNDDYEDAEHLQAVRQTLADVSAHTRRSVLWAHDALVIRHFPDDAKSPLGRVLRFFQHHLLRLDPFIDGPWMIADLVPGIRSLDERRLLVELLVTLYQNEALPLLQRAMEAMADDADSYAKLTVAIERIRHPPKEPSWAREQRRRDEDRKRKHMKQRAGVRGLWREVMGTPDAVLQGPRHKSLTYWVWTVMRRASNSNSTSGWNRGFLQRVFNEDIADRLRTALMKRWREDTPTLRHERDPEQRNTYFERWTLGLAGLYAEAEQPDWARTLSAEEAELAVRYALLDHRMPPWLQDVADEHPDVVHRLIDRTLEDELGPPEAPALHSMFLSNLEYASEPFLQTFIPKIRTWLEQALAHPTPPFAHTGVLAQSTQILLNLGRSEDKAWLQATSRGRLQVHADQEELLFWFPVLAQLDMNQTGEVLDQFAGHPDTNKQAVSAWLGLLFGGHQIRQKQDLGTLQANPELLLRLVLLAYRHVGVVNHEDDDKPRDNLRDEADWARNALLNALLNATGTRAWQAKQALAASPLMEHFRDRALALANERLTEELDAGRMNEAGVRDLEKWRDFSPRTRLEMATLLQGRLDELDDLLLGDKSPRQAWRKYGDETIMRREIARELSRLERNAVVTQETVTAEEKRTDIRMHSTLSAQEGVIELKLGNKDYSVEALHEALRTQLVRQYLAPEDRRVGCLLISLAQERTWEHPESRAKMDVHEVIQWLQARANEIVAEACYELYLSVRLLDLRDRLPPKSGRSTRKRVKKQPAKSSG